MCDASMAMCDGSMGHRRLAPWAMCDGSMGHVRRLHGPQAAGKLPCTTTLSSRRRRETSFAFPSGGARQRARLPTVQKTPVARFDLHRSVGSCRVIVSQVRTPRCLGPTPPECLAHLTDTCSIAHTTTSHLAYTPPPQPPPPPLLPPPPLFRRGCHPAGPPHTPRRLGQWQRWPPRRHCHPAAPQPPPSAAAARTGR